MNIKKITISLAALITIGSIASCSAKKEDSEPVDFINIVKPSEDILIGDVIDLDDYVTISGGYGEKVYDVTVQKGYEDVVSIKGHKVTVLKEGTINLEITAGYPLDTNGMESRISWDSMSLLKSHWKDAIEELTDTYSLVGEDEDGKYGAIHTANYNMFYGWYHYTEDGELAPNGKTIETSSDGTDYISYNYGGYIVASNGKCYEWVADNEDGSDMFVYPGPIDSYEYYFVNMDWSLEWKGCNTVTKNTGKEVLQYKSDVSAKYSEYFDSAIEEMLYCATQLYTEWTKMEITENEDGTFNLVPYYKYYGKTYHDIELTLNVDPNTSVAFLDKYIEDEKEPEPYATNEIWSFMDNLMESKSYTYEAKIGWYTTASGTKASECPSDLIDYGWDSILINDTITGYVNQTCQYAEFGSGEKSVLIEKDNKLYSASNYDEENESYSDTLIATLSEGGDSLEEFGATPKALLTGSDAAKAFVASSRGENNDVVTINYSGGNATKFNEAITKMVIAGWPVYSFCAQGFEKSAFDYFDGKVVIKEDALTVSMNLYYGENAYYLFTVTFKDLGQDKVPTLDISWPID